jgi:hypothetical protein
LLVDYTVPAAWSFTSNGLTQPPLPNIMFNGSSFPVFISTADDQGNPLKYYNQLSYIPNRAAFSDNTFKLVLLSADGTKNNIGNNNLFPTSFTYGEYDSNNITTNLLSSFYAGVLSANFTNSFESIGVTRLHNGHYQIWYSYVSVLIPDHKYQIRQKTRVAPTMGALQN